MMGRWALLSAGLHSAIVLMAIVGLLDYQTNVVDMSQPIPVEFVELTEEVAKSPDPLPSSSQKEEPKEELKPIDIPKPEPTPIPEPVLELKPEEIVPLPKKELEIKEKPKLIEPPKAKPKIKKPPKKKPKPKPKPRDFNSILKNLAKEDPMKRKGKGGILSDRLAASELDQVRKQIERVWRLPAGVQGMHKLSIKVKIYMNQNRTVRRAHLINKSLMNDSGYSILAETALRAVNEFRFKPLLFPPNKYKIWKEITMEFDPRNLL